MEWYSDYHFPEYGKVLSDDNLVKREILGILFGSKVYH